MEYEKLVEAYHDLARKTMFKDLAITLAIVALCVIVAVLVLKKIIELCEKDTINWCRRLRKYNKQQDEYKTMKLDFFYAVQFENKFVYEISEVNKKFSFSEELTDDYFLDKKTAESICKNLGGNIVEVCRETKIK